MEMKPTEENKHRDPNPSNEVQTPTRPTRNIRSPCADSHYEAYILQSRWTVGNLYASNLYLGQTHVKYVEHLDRQQRTWLQSKEWEQQKLVKKLEQLQSLRRSSSPTRHGVDRVMISRHTSREISTKRNSTINDDVLKRTRSTIQADALPTVHEKTTKVYHHGDHHGHRQDYPIKPRHASVSSLPASHGAWSGEQRQDSRRKLVKSVSTLSSGFTRQLSPTRWGSRRKTSLSASARLTGTSYDRVGTSKLVPKWIPMSYRMQNVRAGPMMK